MTTTPTTPVTTEIARGDPHALVASGEELATEAELHTRFGIGTARLRWLRRRRLVRYIDHHPELPAGTGPADRYQYSVRDVERARPAPPPPKPPPTESPSPLPPAAHGQAAPPLGVMHHTPPGPPPPTPPRTTARGLPPAPAVYRVAPSTSTAPAAPAAPTRAAPARGQPDRRREVAGMFSDARRGRA